MRFAYGDRARAIVAALWLKPWQTRKELGVGSMQVERMLRNGLIQRRPGNRKSFPYEYALPGAAREE